jgi:3'(2'), 5'-bisphosphate nucleotidase
MKRETNEEKTLNLVTLLQPALAAAKDASAVIMDVYSSGDFQTEAKGDNSPLTIADKSAHAAIVKHLEPTKIPILSEEGKSIDYGTRKDWEYLWVVDPLDGTKEFIKRNGEFTVNIALVRKGVPVLGVVSVPVTGQLFYAYAGGGAFLQHNGNEVKLARKATFSFDKEGLIVVASRSHMSPETEQFINNLKSPTLVSKGSSLKFLLLAEGKADLYPRFAPTMEWDTAAAHAVVNEVGLKVYEHGTTRELVYNKENLLNPYFLVAP